MIVIIILFIILIIAIFWLWFFRKSVIISWWNRMILSECNNQDKSCINGITSFKNIWDTDHLSVKQLHSMLLLNREQILKEIDDNKSVDINILPTIKEISKLFPDMKIYLKHYYPGDTIAEQNDISKIYYRYHFGIRVPSNDIGLRIDGYDVKWEENEGYVWDNTLRYSIWNDSAEPRTILFADVKRELTGWRKYGSYIIQSLINL